jgi:hypothetical protein
MHAMAEIEMRNLQEPQLRNARTTRTSRTSGRPAHPHPQGGQHRSPTGVTTLDSLSHTEIDEDTRRRVEEFNRELERAVNAEFGGQAF